MGSPGFGAERALDVVHTSGVPPQGGVRRISAHEPGSYGRSWSSVTSTKPSARWGSLLSHPRAFLTVGAVAARAP
jgi:hypothetical protein